MKKTKKEPSKKVKKYKAIPWFNSEKNATFFGINVIMEDNREYHVMDDNAPLFYEKEGDAINEAKKFNDELKNEK